MPLRGLDMELNLKAGWINKIFNVEDFAGVNSTEIINPIDKY